MLRSVTHQKRWIVVGAIVVVAAFALGWLARGSSGPQVLVGSGQVGDDLATLFVGGEAYGLRSSVTWTDAQGSYHASGWPDCLPHLQAVSDIRFIGETVWAGGPSGSIGSNQILWVDCGPR